MAGEQFYDLPFFYVFDADGLTDGLSYQNAQVPLINNSEFILRRIAGLNLVASKFRYYDQRQQARSSATFRMLPDYPVVPEMHYSPDAQIRIDLETVARASWAYAAGGSTPNYYSQIAFQGVRRFYGMKGAETQYPFFSKPYSYRTELTIDWTGRIAPAYQQLNNLKTFQLNIDNYDFELESIGFFIQKNGESVPTPSYGAFKMTLYDATQQQLSTAPVVDFFYTPNTAYYNSAFPAPTTVYPAGSIIRFDIQSLLIESEVPATLIVMFNGNSRFPSCDQ